MFFTSLPVFVRAIIDHDIPEALALPLNPELYHVSQNNLLFDNFAICRDFGMSIVHAYIMFFLPYMAYGKDNQDLWTMSLSTYSIILATVTTRIIVATRTWTLYTLVAYAGSVLVYVAWLFFYDVAGVDMTIRGAAPHLLKENGKFWPLLWFAIGATFVTETFMKYMDENSNPTNVDMVRQAKFEDIKIKAEECQKAAVDSQAGGGATKKPGGTRTRSRQRRKDGYESVGNGEGPRWV
jgi:magnesium-transporting ATPase (P-type)